jgi:hypothetical protein
MAKVLGQSVDFKPGHDAQAVEPALARVDRSGSAIRHHAYQCMSTAQIVDTASRTPLSPKSLAMNVSSRESNNFQGVKSLWQTDRIHHDHF